MQYDDGLIQILEAGADVNCANVSGRTPLMYAVEYQYKALVKKLLGHVKINVNVADGEGNTALLIALEKAVAVNPPPPEPTEEQKLDPDYKPEPIEHIDDSEEVALCETLLHAGADPNSCNHRRRSCLTIVCERSHKVLLHLLLNYHALPEETALNLLDEETTKDIHDRIHAEEKKAELEAARLEKEKRELLEDGMDGIQLNGGAMRNKNPYGQWTEYNDKRSKTGAVFYYNRVSRVVQREKPRDFKPDRNRITTDAIFGMHFYH